MSIFLLTIKRTAQTGLVDGNPDPRQPCVNTAELISFCVCTFSAFFHARLISICWQSLRHVDWNMLIAFMLNLALHLVTRAEHSYRSTSQQTHTCKVLRMLNIGVKDSLFSTPDWLSTVNGTGIYQQQTKALFQREVIP